VKVENFFKEFVLIEKHLLSIAVNFDRRQGFLNLLKHLHSKKILTEDVLTDLNLVWQTRNRIVSSPSGEQEISLEISETFAQLKQKLGI
jgi:hypothetical protein